MVVNVANSRGEHAAEVVVHAASLEATSDPVQVCQREFQPAAFVANLVGVGLGRHAQGDDLTNVEAGRRCDAEKAHVIMFVQNLPDMCYCGGRRFDPPQRFLWWRR